MDWTTLLRSQQADFIQRLKSGHLLHCETEGKHSELTVISGERLKHLLEFCWEMAEKYKQTSLVREVFINNLKGKLGEEVVKARLADFVTEVDYEKRLGGDGKVDFTLTSAPDVGIQVKARHGSIDTIKWAITPEEVEKNAILVCILIQEEVSETQAEYNLSMAGFLPTNMIPVLTNGARFGIHELLYSGGLRSYLENSVSLKIDSLFLTLKKILQEEKFTSEPTQNITLNAESKPYAYLILAIDHLAKKKYQEAIEYLDEAIRLAPRTSEFYSWRSFCCSELGDYRRGIEDCNRLLSLIAEDLAACYDYRGSTHFRVGDKQGAKEDLKKASILYQLQGNQAGYKSLQRMLWRLGVRLE